MGLRCCLGLATVAAAATLTLSCTLLVQFHDEPGAGGCDGAFCGDDASMTEENVVKMDVGADSGLDATAEAGKETGPVEAAVDASADHYAPCGSLASGFYCAEDGLHGYAGSPDDLVQCADGGIAKVTLCDGGCLPLPSPFPDACNPCPGNPDGTYCGRDLAGFPAVNADFLIQCQSANVVQSVACAHGCKSSGTSSSCYP